MAAPEPLYKDPLQSKRIVELAIQLGVLFIFLSWCIDIIRPFVLIVAWACIVAIAMNPLHLKLSSALGDGTKLAATIITVALIAILITPAVMLSDSLLDGAQTLVNAGEAGELQIPPPPDGVKDWPVIGDRVHGLWQQSVNNLPAVLEEFRPQLKIVGAWILNTITGTGVGIVQFVVAFIIGGVLLSNYAKSAGAIHALFNRLMPGRAEEFGNLATSTVRNVAIGIVGVSIFQTLLLTAGFLVISMPGAGLAALAVLVLCIIQIGPGLVSIGAIIYAFSALDTLPAVLFTVWALLSTMCDSVLKPLVFGRGAAVPTLVIFIGAIGGMLAYGIIGLFIGAIVLSLGYKLYLAWLEGGPQEESDEEIVEADLMV